MYRPSNVTNIEWIKYDRQTLTDTNPNYQYVYPMSVEDFLGQMYNKTESETQVDSFTLTTGDSSFLVLYNNDRAPTCYTTFDDGTILFDALNTTVDTNLQASKSLARGEFTKTFLFQDSYIPDLDEQQFDLLLNESIALASVELKQQLNPKAEEAARRGWITLQRTKEAVHLQSPLQRLPDYGRK